MANETHLRVGTPARFNKSFNPFNVLLRDRKLNRVGKRTGVKKGSCHKALLIPEQWTRLYRPSPKVSSPRSQ